MTDPVDRAAVREMVDEMTVGESRSYRKDCFAKVDALPAFSPEGPAWQPIAEQATAEKMVYSAETERDLDENYTRGGASVPPSPLTARVTLCSECQGLLPFHFSTCPVLEQPPAACLDCGLPYDKFPVDVILPRPQWLEIHPSDHGLLCAACIVARAAKVPGVTCVHAILEVAPRRSVDAGDFDER